MNGYDVTVIGAGPGGYVAAIRAAQLGLKVAIVERDPQLGGVCTLRGCIPTKALLHTADVLREAQHGAELGVRADGIRLDWPAAMQFKRSVVDKNSAGVAFLMRKNRIDVHAGTGALAGAGRVRVVAADGTERVVDTRNVILATGTAPRPLPGVPFDGERILSSDHVLELPAVPSSLLVIGAGAVGVEFASMYARFGAKVTLVEALPAVLPLEDAEISRELEKQLRRAGIEVHTGTQVKEVVRRERDVVVTIAKDTATTTVSAEKVLVAIGRRPLTDRLGLETVGLATDRGYLRVDAQLRTSVDGVWAIGDIVPTPALAHVASREGVVAAEAIAGRQPQPIRYEHVPSCTYAAPEVASVGLTEARARERGHDVRTGKFPFSALGKARVLNDTTGFVKVVADARYHELLGVHLIGPRVTELLAEATVSLRLEATVDELVQTIHAHPTLTEAVQGAAEAALGEAIHL